MALSQDEMQAIKLEALGGEAAAKLWNEAVNAIHAYAQASGCPAGGNVFDWIANAADAYQQTMSAAIRESMEPRP